MAKGKATTPDANEDAQFIDIFWGILRVPLACVSCGKPTRTPSYHDAEGPTGPTCGECFRISVWGH